MIFILQPWQLMIAIVSSWINQQQQEVIEYLRTENQVLKEKHGKERILLDDNQRRRLAVKGKILVNDSKNLDTVYSRHDPALASNVGCQRMGLQREPKISRTPSCQRSDRQPRLTQLPQ